MRKTTSSKGAPALGRFAAARLISTLALALPLALPLASPAGAAPPGVDILAQNCMTCHGHEGRRQSPLEGGLQPIAGIDADELVAALTAFREDQRPSTIMGRLMKPFADDDIRALADYFAAR